MLSTDRLVLRPFRIEDAPDVQRLAGDVGVADTALDIPHPCHARMVGSATYGRSVG